MTELPANPAKWIISLLRHSRSSALPERSSRTGRAAPLGSASRCSDRIKTERSGAAQTVRVGSETADLAGGTAPPRAPLRAPCPLPSPCPPRLLRRAPPTPSEKGVSPPRARPVQPLAGRVAAGCRASPATQIRSSHAEGVDKCGKVHGEVERCAAVAWHSEGHNSAPGAHVLTACPPQGKDTNP